MEQKVFIADHRKYTFRPDLVFPSAEKIRGAWGFIFMPDGQLLVSNEVDGLNLLGGGRDVGETGQIDTLKRECFEEAGAVLKEDSISYLMTVQYEKPADDYLKYLIFYFADVDFLKDDYESPDDDEIGRKIVSIEQFLNSFKYQRQIPFICDLIDLMKKGKGR